MDDWFVYSVYRAVFSAWWKNAWRDRLPSTDVVFDSRGTLYRIEGMTRWRVGDKR